MKTLSLCLLFAIFQITANAQKKLPTLGKADQSELDMKECPFQKDASALKLFETEEKDIMIGFGLKIKTERRVRIKIFNQKGYDAATITVPYISHIKGTKITNIDAYIYYKDSLGKIVTEKVGKSQIYRDKADDQLTQIKFTFPNVRPGCVVEYRYEKIEKNSLHLEPWYFQDFLPTLYSSFTISHPSEIEITRRLIGIDSVLIHSKSERGSVDNRTYLQKTFSLSNIIAFEPEPLMTSIADNLTRIEFALQPGSLGYSGVLFVNNKWKTYASILSQVTFFGKQFEINIPGTEAIIDSAKKMVSKEEKINYLFQQVKNQIKWDNQQTFYSGDLTTAWQERKGNSADINLTVLNFLRRAGVSCYPLLISTRHHGQTDPNFFSLGQFNGLDILIIDSVNNYVLDGTRKYQSYKTPPENILNRYAFNADTSYANWVFISDSRPLLKNILSVSAILSDSGQVQGEAFMSFYDHSKVLRMADKNKTSEDEKEEEKEFLKKDFTYLKIDSVVVDNADNDLLPLTEKFFFSYHPSTTDKFLFIDPFFLSNFRKNPFADSLRNYRMDFNSKQYLKTSVNITIPDNYEIDYLPANIKLRMPDSSILFERIIYKQENKILFVNKMEILYPLFEKEEYPDVKEFFNRMYAMIQEQIILLRKN